MGVNLHYLYGKLGLSIVGCAVGGLISFNFSTIATTPWFVQITLGAILAILMCLQIGLAFEFEDDYPSYKVATIPQELCEVSVAFMFFIGPSLLLSICILAAIEGPSGPLFFFTGEWVLINGGLSILHYLETIYAVCEEKCKE